MKTKMKKKKKRRSERKKKEKRRGKKRRKKTEMGVVGMEKRDGILLKEKEGTQRVV